MINLLKMQAGFIRVAFCAVCGVLSIAFLKNDFFDKVSQELIAVFGLMMAAVLPTMVLTASVLRSGGLSVKKIEEYRDALIRQLQVWAGLFLLSLLSCTAVVVGKAIAWEWKIELAFLSIKWDWNAAQLLNGVIVALLVLLSLRAKAVIDGIRSLIDLSADIAVSEARQREEASNRAIEVALAQSQPRPGFGDYVSLKTGRKTQSK